MKADENVKSMREMLLPAVAIGTEGRAKPGIPVEGMKPAEPSFGRRGPSQGG